MSPTEIANKVLSWASDLETNTIDQARTTASMSFVQSPLALLPDAHLGRGSTIGSVIATQGAIIPAACGVDLGCGVVGVETTLTSHDLPDNLNHLMGGIRKSVPAGMGKGHENQDIDAFEEVAYTGYLDLTDKQKATARSQYGTLGSGNHFVEICLDESDHVWAILHSGSRGIGNQLAQYHIKIAKGFMKQWFIELPDPDLAYFPEGTPEFNNYIADMLWAQDYAKYSRETMMSAVLSQLWQTVTAPAAIVQSINNHHNFCQQERHHGKNLWITRKGAIQADVGRKGIIPGSMGTRSYVVSGLGNPASYNSAAHGAGRRMSRTAARKTLTVESLQEAMVGKVWDDYHAKSLLDEHPDSYKDINQVMADQEDLVTIDHTLTQILNYKGN